MNETSPLHIVFLDGRTLNPGDTDWEPFERLGDFTAYDRTPPDKVVERAREADILIVNKTRLTDAHFGQLPRLRLVCVAATGFDTVDVEAARRHHVPVCNAAGYGTEAVAQMTLALLLEATNHVGQYAADNRAGRWSRGKDFCYWESPVTELHGKRLGIVGFGNIGQAVARICHALGMEIYAATSKGAGDLPGYVTPRPTGELFRTCHVVSLNCPLTEQNTSFVNAALLADCRPGLILINTARGRLVDDEAVAQALRDDKLGAYCCDVLSQEPPVGNHPLLAAPRCYVTPHIGWATIEARQRLMGLVAQNIKDFLDGCPHNVVNA